MALYLALAREEDIPLIVPIQFAAFHPTDTLHRLIYPAPHPVSPSVISSTIARHLKAWRTDPHVTWLVIKDPSIRILDPSSGQETDRIVAAAKWIIWPPGEREEGIRWPEVKVDWIFPSAPDGEKNFGPNGAPDDEEYVSWVVEQVYGRRGERVAGPAVLLDSCFVDPEYHKRGAGGMLVKWGVDKADELGVRGFVEASAKGRRLYESQGFREIEDVKLRGGEVRASWETYGEVEYWFMER
ncbi:uncharacterized protein LY89DRAFT_690644 [Mollisia scopiformis]|uniref:N-acetyltransferase domain-containing protein n=1 Tax=Mollisia scopiformis TaxID=149040 RepID=A0A132BA40_MOLSC|nr:uncharacterized protein LY89DRAFT_690644 [Mollisia scopiformis]KUJ09113.1 hypothetical protein LY89DRAFT_690644 [Mollisia scopiformis]